MTPRFFVHRRPKIAWAARRWSSMSVDARKQLKSKAALSRAERAFVRRSLPELESVARVLRDWGANDDEVAEILSRAFSESKVRTRRAVVRPIAATPHRYMPRKAAFAGIGLGLLLVAAIETGSTAEATPVGLSIQNQYCLPGGGVGATLSWYGNNPAAGQQRVDVSLANNGWLEGTYSASTQLPAGANSLTVNGMASGAVYFVRVSQQVAGGYWDSSQTVAYTTPTFCETVYAKPTIITRTTTGTNTTSQVAGVRTDSPTTPWSATAVASLKTVHRGNTVNLGITVRQSYDAVALVDIEIFGPNGNKVYQKYYDQVSFKGDYKAFTTGWQVPVGAEPGTYTVKVGVFRPGFGALYYWNDNAGTVIVTP